MKTNQNNQTKQPIEMHKKYKTRDGRPVRILCTDRKDVEDRTFHVIALVTTEGYEEIRAYSKTGQCFIDEDSALDLIEVQPWEDFKIDDPVLVSDDGLNWEKGHFAGLDEEGNPLTFPYGGTSWSSDGCEFVWEYCKKPDQV